MDKIKQLVSTLPRQVRTLFACLMIAIGALASVVVYQNNLLNTQRTEQEEDKKTITVRYESKVDSLNRIIYQISTESKKDAIESLERIIDQQKEIIEEQKTQTKKQEKIKQENQKIIKGNYDKINNLK